MVNHFFFVFRCRFQVDPSEGSALDFLRSKMDLVTHFGLQKEGTELDDFMAQCVQMPALRYVLVNGFEQNNAFVIRETQSS